MKYTHENVVVRTTAAIQVQLSVEDAETFLDELSAATKGEGVSFSVWSALDDAMTALQQLGE